MDNVICVEKVQGIAQRTSVANRKRINAIASKLSDVPTELLKSIEPKPILEADVNSLLRNTQRNASSKQTEVTTATVLASVVPSKREETQQRPGSSHTTEFHERFHLSQEILVEWYSCALSLRILLHGKLYISNNYVCFFSVFNDSTIFGTEPTTLVIPFADVESIAKKNSAFFFPNAIEIESSSSKKYFFASFIMRDKVYDQLVLLWKLYGDTNRDNDSLQVSAETVEPPAKPCWKPVSCQAYPEAVPELFPNKSLSKNECLIVWATSAEALFNEVFSLKQEAIWLKFLEEVECKNLEVSPWSPEIKKDALNSPGVYKAEIRYARPVSQTALTTMLKLPSFANVIERCTLYLYSSKMFMIESRITVDGLPYSSYFEILYRYRLTESSCQEQTQLDTEYEVIWKQSTVLRSKIERYTLNDLRYSFQQFAEIITKYLNPEASSNEIFPQQLQMDKPMFLHQSTLSSSNWDYVSLGVKNLMGALMTKQLFIALLMFWLLLTWLILYSFQRRIKLLEAKLEKVLFH